MHLRLKRKHLILNALFFCFLSISTASFAQNFCQNHVQIEKILLKNKITTNFDSNYFSCKSLPTNPQVALIAYADWVVSPQDENSGDYNLTFLSVDHQTQKIENIYSVEELITSDAIELSSIALDLAAYNVSKNKRLIGLRLNYSGHSQPNPYSMTLLNLYDLQNKKQVLDSLIVDQYQVETDTRCNADIRTRKSILSLQNTQSKAYFDIRVLSKIDQYQMSGTQEHCVESKHKLSQHSFLLKFDGKKYQLPKVFRDEYQY